MYLSLPVFLPPDHSASLAQWRSPAGGEGEGQLGRYPTIQYHPRTFERERERERSHSHPHTHTHTHTGGFVSSLYGISGQFLQQEHEQFPPFLHAGVEEGLIPYLTLVPQILVTHTHTTTTTTTKHTRMIKDFHQVVFSACDLPSRSRD